MSYRLDWSEWILQKNSEAKQEELKKSDSVDLSKGAMRRLAPAPSTERSHTIHDWIVPGGSDPRDREKIPRLEGSSRIRALHRLSGKTKVRINPQTKQREFLLHRGMYIAELEGHKANNVNHKTSWTPDIDIAHGFTRTADEHLVSAWIPEEQIHNIPIAQGSHLIVDQDHSNKELAEMARKEYEIIVNPHNMDLLAEPKNKFN